MKNLIGPVPQLALAGHAPDSRRVAITKAGHRDPDLYLEGATVRALP